MKEQMPAGNCVYMLECEDGSFYIGWTNDPEKRFRAHCSGKGAKYTRSHKPVRVAYLKYTETKQEAQKLEFALKRLTHQEKEKLAEGAELVR